MPSDLLNSALTGSADLRSADPVKAEFKRSNLFLQQV